MKLPISYSTVSWQERREAREQYIINQRGKCYYCKETLAEEPPKRITKKIINRRLFPPGFFNYPIHLQHNHDTDKTEGAVHAYCNAVLWQYEGR